MPFGYGGYGSRLLCGDAALSEGVHDVGARREIKRIWLDLSAKGHAILLASTDAEELVDACDRVVVMSHGHQVGEISGLELTEKNLLRMATDG